MSTDRCACPPRECHAIGNPDNCAAMAGRRLALTERRVVGVNELALAVQVLMSVGRLDVAEALLKSGEQA